MPPTQASTNAINTKRRGLVERSFGASISLSVIFSLTVRTLVGFFCGVETFFDADFLTTGVTFFAGLAAFFVVFFEGFFTVFLDIAGLCFLRLAAFTFFFAAALFVLGGEFHRARFDGAADADAVNRLTIPVALFAAQARKRINRIFLTDPNMSNCYS